LAPQNPVVPRIGGRQQIRVLATYIDGEVRDVTQEAYVDSGNTEVATASRIGLMTAVRRGEAPILARYEAPMPPRTLTVMGDRSGFTWKQPASWSKIDELAADKWQRMKIEPSGLSTDSEFFPPRLSRLDRPAPLGGRDRKVPRRQARHSRQARRVDRPPSSAARNMSNSGTNKWADLLQVNRKFLGPEGAVSFRAWIRENVSKNTPLRSVRAFDPDGQRLEPRKPGLVVLQDPREPAPTNGEHDAPVPGRALQLQTSATTIRSSVGRRTSTIRRPPISPRRP